MTTGYSGTPLAQKLNLKDGLRVWWDGMPDSVRDEIATDGFAVGAARRTAKRRSTPRISSSPSAPTLEAKLHQLLPLLDPAGHDLGQLAEESVQDPDRHHRGRDPRRLPADGAGRREGVRGRRDLVGPEAGRSAAKSRRSPAARWTGLTSRRGGNSHVIRPIALATAVSGTLDILFAIILTV